jgi:hypothetical protein
MIPVQKINVFVSSTSKDLQEYRAVAKYVILDMDWTPKMQEHFDTDPSPTISACRKKLDQCQLMLLLVAFRRGWVPTQEQGGNGTDSITAFELAFARERGIPVLVMLAKENWPGNLWEDDAAARQWIKKFRNDLNQIAKFFEYEEPTSDESQRLPTFRALLREQLVTHRERLLAETPVAVAGQGVEYLESAKQALIEGSGIPFIGAGIYGDGPLSSRSLASALHAEECGEGSCIATAAEYRERFLKTRQRFLNDLRNILNQQTHQLNSAIPPVFQMILDVAKVKSPPLIVSTTHDMVLENQLKQYSLVCHIVRCVEQGKQFDGQVLVLRQGEKPKVCPADKIELEKGESVIYKPLGSPLLDDSLAPELEIDTTVITETDYLTFLGRMSNQSTQVPSVFNRILRGRLVLFLGYALDEWEYRLATKILECVGLESGQWSSLAVREHLASPMEVEAWRKLRTDLIPMQLEEFAKKVRNSLTTGQKEHGERTISG